VGVGFGVLVEDSALGVAAAVGDDVDCPAAPGLGGEAALAAGVNDGVAIEVGTVVDVLVERTGGVSNAVAADTATVAAVGAAVSVEGPVPGVKVEGPVSPVILDWLACE
jgi:hypothetical protein